MATKTFTVKIVLSEQGLEPHRLHDVLEKIIQAMQFDFDQVEHVTIEDVEEGDTSGQP